MITVKDIFNYVRIINPAQHTSSSMGRYSTSLDNQIADNAIKEISEYLPKESLAHKVLFDVRGRYTEKQLWVISYELMKSADFVAFMETRKAEKEEEEAYEKAARAIKSRKRKEKAEKAKQLAEIDEANPYMSAEEVAALGAGEIVEVRMSNDIFEATVKEVQGDKIIMVINENDTEKMFLVAYVKIMKKNKEEINNTENNADEETCQPQNENKMEIRDIRAIDSLSKVFDFTFNSTTEYLYLREGELHMDNVRQIDVKDKEALETFLRDLFNEKGAFEITVQSFDELEYNSTLLANTAFSFTDVYQKNDIITVFIIKQI